MGLDYLKQLAEEWQNAILYSFSLHFEHLYRRACGVTLYREVIYNLFGPPIPSAYTYPEDDTLHNPHGENS
jgi:hypothetical protein